MRILYKVALYLIVCFVFGAIYSFKEQPKNRPMPSVSVTKKNLTVQVKTIGELEAAHSTTISSSIKGEQGKIIDLIADGVYVTPGQILVKLDPTPFEEKLAQIRLKIKEQIGKITCLEQALEWEISQAEHKNRMAAYEVETAQLELDKIVQGDGPLEISRLKAAMQKARVKFEELNAYSQDLIELENQGFLNPTEIKHAQKKIVEEAEAFETAKSQYESYLHHVHPMQIKKAETHLKRARVNQEETLRAGHYGVDKASTLLAHARQEKQDEMQRLGAAKRELKLCEIQAPTSGMVVHREDYRNGQKRKPRIGDVLLMHQPIIDLPDLSSMLVKTKVRETDLFKIAIGKKASVEIDAYPELLFEATISSIGVLALGDFSRAQEDKYFEVRLLLNASDSKLRPGMTTRVTIHALMAENALTIPIHAVFEEGKQAYCYLQKPGNTFEKRALTLGISNEQTTEVKTGLEEGLKVCLLNPHLM